MYIFTKCNHKAEKYWLGQYPDKPDTTHCYVCGKECDMNKECIEYTFKHRLLELLHIRKYETRPE